MHELFVVVDVTGLELEIVDDSESFEQVFERELEPMIRVAFLLLNSQAQAEEAVQEAFTTLLNRFESVTNPGGFVRTATVNRCRDLLRRRGREQNVLRRVAPVSDQSDHGQLVSGDLHDVLAGLSQRRREVVVLRYYLGHSHAEIAALLEMKQETVRTTLHRALADLRGVLS